MVNERPGYRADTGPLVALFNERDARHQWVKKEMAAIQPPLLTCEAVVSETCFLLGRNGGTPATVLRLPDIGLINIAFIFVYPNAFHPAIDGEICRYTHVLRRCLSG